MAPKNVHVHKNYSTHKTDPTCFGQLCGHHQGHKTQKFDTIQIQNKN